MAGTKGIVIRSQNDKTVYVSVERWRKHPLYGKIIRSSKVYAVHDAENRCQVKDRVLIVPGRPISKTKSWYVKEVLKPANTRLKKDDSEAN